MQDPSKPIWINPNPKATPEQKNTELPRIFLATPVHSECSIHYTQSLLKFQQECLMKNILVSFSLLKSSLVTQGRKLCVNGMLEEGDRYTHLLFIDSDIEFKAETIFKLIAADKDVIAAPYPLKAIDWQKVHNRINERGNLEPDLLSKQGYTWPIKLENKEQITVEGGIAEVSHAPTGCMLIKRSVFDKM